MFRAPKVRGLLPISTIYETNYHEEKNWFFFSVAQTHRNLFRSQTLRKKKKKKKGQSHESVRNSNVVRPPSTLSFKITLFSKWQLSVAPNIYI